MMPQATARTSKKSTKSAYKPRMQFLSATEYLIPSESYGGHIVYLVTISAGGHAVCECTGYEYRHTCKHSRLAQAAHAYRARPQHIRSQSGPSSNGAAGLLEAFGA